MATKQSLTCSGSKPAPIPTGMEEINVRESVATTAADIAINNVVQLLVLPANCVPTEYLLDITDLDTGTPAILLDFGLLTTSVNASGQRVNGTTISIAAADGGDEWIDNSTLAQAGGIALDTASAALHRVLMAVTPVDYDRVVAVVVAVAATGALAGTIACELGYRAAR
jgi:hypothetical protein